MKKKTTVFFDLAENNAGERLITSPNQMIYCVVRADGNTVSISLLEACRFYLHCESHGKLLWSMVEKAPQEQSGKQKPRSTEKWKRKMREALESAQQSDD